jgi:hypothetical protein
MAGQMNPENEETRTRLIEVSADTKTQRLGPSDPKQIRDIKTIFNKNYCYGIENGEEKIKIRTARHMLWLNRPI